MNLKPILSVCAAVSLVCTGCREEQLPTPVIKTTEASMTVSADAHTETLSYSIENPIDGQTVSARASVDWIHTFTYTEGSVSFEVDQNVSDSRTGVLTLSYASAQDVTVEVEQMAAGESIALEPGTLSFLPDGGDLKVTVKSGKAWALTGGAEWVSASAEDGMPGDEVTFTAEENVTDEPRSTQFVFICGTNRATLDVTQSFEGRIIVEKQEYQVDGYAHEFSITLQSNMTDVTVEIPEDADWLTQVATKAMETMTLNFAVTENTGEADRTAVVVFSNRDASEQVTITQIPSFPADVLTRVSDSSFKAYLQKNFDTDGDGKVSRAEAEAVTDMVVDGYDFDVPISTFAGIEYFENLTSVGLPNNSMVEEIDLSSLGKLVTVDVSGCNRLVKLNLDGCTSVTYINIGLCSAMTSIDVSAMPSLNTLIAYSSGITSIDVTANTQLESLSVNGTKVNTIDLSHNTELVSLSLTTEFSSLDLSANTKLETLTVGGANLTSLDLSSNTALRELNVSNSGFVSLDHSMCPDLARVTYDYCSKLTTIDVSKNTRMSYISAYMCNALTTVIMYEGQDVSDTFGVASDMIQYVPFDYPDDLSAGIKDVNLRKYILNEFDFNYSTYESDGKIDAEEAARITSLELSGRGDIVSLTGLDYFTNLETINASDNVIGEADFFFNTKLREVNLCGNRLTSIDFAKNQGITDLDLSYNKLTSVTNLPNALVDLDLSNNQLTSINAAYLSNLKTFNIANNKLTDLDVAYNTAMTDFDCSNNQLASIRVWTLSGLEAFNISNNPLRVIGDYYVNSAGENFSQELTYLKNLKSLDCSTTRVKELDISGCPMLQTLVATGCAELEHVYTAPGQTVTDMRLDDPSVVSEKPAE